MNLSIKAKLNVISAVAVVSLVVLVSIAWINGERVEGAVGTSDDKAGQVALVNEMKLANLEMVLAAMDSIIDKAEGQIQPERVEVIADSVKKLKDAGAALIEAATTEEEKSAMTAIVCAIITT